MKKFALAIGSLAMTGAAAQAADLPFVEPVEYVQVCDTYGKGFFYIPGTDTCLKISGLLRADERFEDDDLDESRNDFVSDVRARVQFDSRTETAWGTLRSYIEIEARNDGDPNNSHVYDDGTDSMYARQAYIQVAGITAGRVGRSFYDFVPYKHVADFFSDEQTNTLAYTGKLADGFTATIAVEDKYYRAQPADTLLGGGNDYVLDQVWPNVLGAFTVKQDWGDAQLSAVIQDNEGDIVHTDDSDDLGWAVQAGLSINLPTENKGSKIWAIGAYTEGALSYIGSEDFVHFRNEGLSNTNFRDQSTDGAGLFLNTEAWSAGGGFAWAWSKEFTSNVGGIYVDVDQAFEDDFTFLTLEANTYWTPIPGLSLALALQYSDTDVTNVAGGFSSAPAEDDHYGVITRLERSF
jgi:hypothetical protein